MEMASALTKRENASLYSETCSSVNESAYMITLSVKYRPTNILENAFSRMFVTELPRKLAGHDRGGDTHTMM